MNSRDGLKVIIQDLAFGWLLHYFIETSLVRVVEEQLPCCPTHFQFSFSVNIIDTMNWCVFLVTFSSLRSEIRSHLLLAYLCTFLLSVLYWIILFSYLKSLENPRAYSLDLFFVYTCSLGDHILSHGFSLSSRLIHQAHRHFVLNVSNIKLYVLHLPFPPLPKKKSSLPPLFVISVKEPFAEVAQAFRKLRTFDSSLSHTVHLLILQ